MYTDALHTRPDDVSAPGEGTTLATGGPHPADEVRPVLKSFVDGLGIQGNEPPWPAGADIVSLDASTLIPALLAFAARLGVPEHGCVYVSTPITTGRNHFAQDVQGTPLARSAAIDANRRHAEAVVARTRKMKAGVVIDPTRLIDVPGWRQNDYHALWVATIERYVAELAFVDDWQYSVGCTKEFSTAVRLSLPVADEGLTPFDYEYGLALVRTAVRESRQLSGNGALLAGVLDEIERLMSPPWPDEGKSGLRDDG